LTAAEAIVFWVILVMIGAVLEHIYKEEK